MASVNGRAGQQPLRLDRLETIVDALPDGVIACDGDRTIVVVNARFCRMAGRTRDQLVGMQAPHDFWAVPEPPDAVAALQATGALELERELVRRDGSRLPVLFSVSLVRTAEREPALYVATVKDIADRARAQDRLRASEASFRLLAENTDVLVVRHAPDGRPLYVSPASRDLLGRTPAELAQSGWRALVHPEDQSVLREAVGELMAGAPRAAVTMRARHRDTGWVWVETVVRTLRDEAGAIREIHSSTRDVSARRQTEESLRRSEAEQAALRRVATEVASEADSDRLFALVAKESALLLGVEAGLVVRFDSDLELAVGSFDPRDIPPGGPWSLHGDGVSGQVWRTGRTARVPSYAALTDPTMSGWARERGYVSGVGAPIRVGARLWGAVVIMTIRREPIASDAGQRLARFAELLALAIANTEDRERIVSEAVAGIFGGALDMEGTLRAIADSARRALHADRATCYVGSADGGRIEAIHSTETDPRRRRAIEGAIGSARESLPIWEHMETIDDGVLVVEDAAASPLMRERLRQAMGAGAFIGLRLEHTSVRVDGEPALLGFLFVTYARSRSFSTRERMAARSLGTLAALALANARLHSSTLESLSAAEERAASDPLTGLANHRAFHERLAQETARAERHGRPLALALLDLDHFKRVNDEHGHQTGDAVLQEVAERLAALSREGECLARVGGEEFAWILPDADALSAWAAADRARQAVADRPFSAVGPLTVSAGVAELSQAGDAGELFRLADGALYWAKAHGRNVTFRYSPEVVEELSAEERAERLQRSQAITSIRVLARAVDAKDPSTREHSERVAELAVRLARRLGWSAERAAALRLAGLVHDVGKIGVPDAVLGKAGELTLEEYELVKAHAALGAQIVADVLSAEQTAWIGQHHERPDGSGYPEGVGYAEIADGALILTVADAWDVMTVARPYKIPYPADGAMAIVRAAAGAQFCPRVAAALEALWQTGELAPPGPPSLPLRDASAG